VTLAITFLSVFVASLTREEFTMKNTKTIADMDTVICGSVLAFIMGLLWLGSHLAL